MNRISSDLKRMALLLVLLLHIRAVFADHHTYYVDAVNGNDKNKGLSAGAAWKTLPKLNALTLGPGDVILLKRGQTFHGSLFLKGSGSADQRVKLGTYGTGKRPVIYSSGQDYAVRLIDAQYWEITGIETSGGNQAGIFIGCSKDSLTLNNISISDCYVHDIGDTAKIDWDFSKSTGGIIVVNGLLKDGKPVFYNSVFNQVVINNCSVKYNHRWTCISISSGKLYGRRGNANYIRNCTAAYSAADGIRMNGVENSFIEYCVMYRNGAWPNYPGKNLGGLGAWFFDAENCSIQYSEASHVQAAATDGGAFDIDFWQKNSTVRYCYGHDCAGYGVSVFGADPSIPTENSVVHDNIFSNNGRNKAFAYEGDFFVFTWNGGLLNGVKIYNNISYWNPAADSPALKCDADFTGNNPNIFVNNIIHSQKKQLAYLKNDTLQCDSNIYRIAGDMAPVWKRKDKVYQSLADWQQATGQEIHSRLEAWESSAAGLLKNPGPKAPGFILPDMNNKLRDLKTFFGNTILLSFIDASDAASVQSQLTFIKSMKTQYAESGLNIILIDESSLTNQLINFIEDHELGDFVVLRDNKKENAAGKYGAAKFPSTYLISKKGGIQQTWNKTALSQELAIAIEESLGAALRFPHFRPYTR